MEHYNNLKLPWLVIAKTNQGEVCDLENSCPTDKKPFYQIYFSGLGLGDFSPPINYFIKRINRKLFVEEKAFIAGREKEVGSLNEAREKMLGLMSELEESFRKYAQEKGHNLNVYGWLGIPDINELGLTHHFNW